VTLTSTASFRAVFQILEILLGTFILRELARGTVFLIFYNLLQFSARILNSDTKLHRAQ
jgi:hypothetical protein